MLFSPTAMGISGFTGLPSATHFSISTATCQGQAAVAVAAFAGIQWRRPQAPGIICASQFACLQKILNTARTTVIFFYLSNEGVSVLENAAHLGLPVPEKLKEVLAQIHNRAEKSGDLDSTEEDKPNE